MRRGRGNLSVLTEEYIQSLEHTIPQSDVDSKMLALVDAGCSKTIFAEAHVKPYVFDKAGVRTRCTLGDGRSTLECAYVASVHCRVEDLSGTPVDIILRGAVSHSKRKYQAQVEELTLESKDLAQTAMYVQRQ
eukprot:GHVR01137958.1.p1 GENE.GHVR01137958.1~~GHVR01137958.1.p1  ORF type:complete len:133 (-),score=11.14 GHVR01137958.1:2024-2422(-)